MTLVKAVMKTLKRFSSRGIYGSKVSVSLDNKNRLHIHKGDTCEFSDLEKLLEKGEPRKVIFEELDVGANKVKAIAGLKSLYNRAIQEICMKLPFPEMKNKIYRRLGMDVGKDVVVAPNVIFDYLNPNLITIGEGSMIGEEAMVLAHFLYPRKYEIGPVKIGKECTIGVRTIIHPGVSIGDYAKIGTNVVVYKDVPQEAVIKSS